jgi:hypothetical protein
VEHLIPLAFITDVKAAVNTALKNHNRTNNDWYMIQN